ncbi:hypothetical protein D3C87_1571860 [compost metagenome]
MEEGDDDARCTLCLGGCNGFDDGLHVRRLRFAAVGSQSRRNAEDHVTRNELVGTRAEERIDVRHSQARQFDHVLEAGIGHQRQRHAAPLDDGVDADRRTMHEAADRSRIEPFALSEKRKPGHQFRARIVRRGQNLQGGDPA